MTTLQHFHEDSLALLDARLARAAIDRRTALKLAAALGVTAPSPSC